MEKLDDELKCIEHVGASHPSRSAIFSLLIDSPNDFFFPFLKGGGIY